MRAWHEHHDHYPRHPHHRFHRSLILIGLVLLLLPLLLGTVATAATTTTFKWRDDRGQLHLTDTPPPPGVPYEEVTSAGRPTSASATAPGTTQAPPVTRRDEGSVATGDTDATADAATRDQDAAATQAADRRCIETLYQLELLTGKYKVYKPGAGDARSYLDDADRPAEIARLQAVRGESCIAEQPLQGSQKRRAAELFVVLGADCREAREELRRLEQPDSRTSRNEYERHVDWMSRYCPDLSYAGVHTDVWLVDRVWQRQAK
jgi:hypothetical protein